MKKYLYYKIQYFLSVFLHQLISVVIDKTEPFAVISFPLIPKDFPRLWQIETGRIDMLQIIVSYFLKILIFVCRFQCAGIGC